VSRSAQGVPAAGAQGMFALVIVNGLAVTFGG